MARRRSRWDADERRLASIAIEKLDDFVEAGDSATAGTLREGRQLWARLRKSESYRKGDGTGGGCSIRAGKSGLRNEFRGLHKGDHQRPERYARFLVRRESGDPGRLRKGRRPRTPFAVSARSAAVSARPGNPLNAVLGGGLGFGAGTAIRRPAGGRTDRRGAGDGRRQSGRSGSAAIDAAPGRYGESDRSPGRDPDASGPCRADSGDDEMTDPTDSVGIDGGGLGDPAGRCHAVDGGRRAAPRAKRRLWKSTKSPTIFCTLDSTSCRRSKDSGDIVAEAFGWPDAASLSAFLAVGTRAGATLH